MFIDDMPEKEKFRKVSVGPNGQPEYQLTAKASDCLYKLDVLKALKQNSPEEIIKRIAKDN